MKMDLNNEEIKISFLSTSTSNSTGEEKIPKDTYHIAYIIYFTLGAGYLLPWNAFITAVDYFDYLYPNRNVDPTFSVVCQPVMLLSLIIIVCFLLRKSNAYFRINLGLILFTLALITVPILDLFFIKGRPGLYVGFYVTVGAVALSALANAFVQGGMIGSAGELPERYMHAVVAGTAASGMHVHIYTISWFALDCEIIMIIFWAE